VRKILTLVSNTNVKIRKEAEKFIEQNLNVFLPVIEDYPQSSNVLHLLGKIFGKGEDYEKAIQFFYQIIEEKPLDINSWLAIALINVLRRNFNEVFRILKKIQQEIDQFDYRTYLIWSECLLEMENQSEANKMKEIASLLR
jgi:tetratricopeptide (TPR) repeat protein